MKQFLSVAAAVSLAAVLAPVAQAAGSSKPYLTDKAGNIVMTKTGSCIRTKDWTAKTADQACMAKK
jgi:hypothetical protein